MKEEQFLVAVVLHQPGQPTRLVEALLDSGASCCFIDWDFVLQGDFPIQAKAAVTQVEGIDGEPLKVGPVSHETHPIRVKIDGHQDAVVFDVIQLPGVPLVLGLPWLECCNPVIDWGTKTMKVS